MDTETFKREYESLWTKETPIEETVNNDKFIVVEDTRKKGLMVSFINKDRYLHIGECDKTFSIQDLVELLKISRGFGYQYAKVNSSSGLVSYVRRNLNRGDSELLYLFYVQEVYHNQDESNWLRKNKRCSYFHYFVQKYKLNDFDEKMSEEVSKILELV